MKKIYLYTVAVMVAAFLFSIALSAQQATVKVRVEKEGKVVKDTTYQFDDAEQAEHAVKVMEVMSEHEEHLMKHEFESGDHPHGEHVMVIKSGNEEDIEVHVGEDGDCGHKKKIKVMVSEDEEGEWKVIEKEIEETDGEVEITKIIEEGEGEEVKVIVVKKKEAKDKSKKQ